MNFPLNNRNASGVFEGYFYNTSESELIGHKVTDDKGLMTNKFYMLYRTSGGRYFVYDQERVEGIDLISSKAFNVTLKPIKKAEAEALFEGLDDKQMTFSEAFKRIVEA
jgi:hypothetical protein